MKNTITLTMNELMKLAENTKTKEQETQSYKRLPKVYLAAPLFSQSEIAFNNELAERIRKIGFMVYNPCENMSINDKTKYADSVMITQADNDELDSSQVLVAILDGQVIDSGVAAEIGRFTAMGGTVLGLYTDSRQGSHGNSEKLGAVDEIGENQFSYLNLYVVGLIKQHGWLHSSVNHLLLQLGFLEREFAVYGNLEKENN